MCIVIAMDILNMKNENKNPADVLQNPPEIRSKGRPASKRIDNAGLPNKRRCGGGSSRKPFTETTVSNVSVMVDDNSNDGEHLQRKRKCGVCGKNGHYAPRCPEAN